MSVGPLVHSATRSLTEVPVMYGESMPSPRQWPEKKSTLGQHSQSMQLTVTSPIKVLVACL